MMSHHAADMPRMENPSKRLGESVRRVDDARNVVHDGTSSVTPCPFFFPTPRLASAPSYALCFALFRSTREGVVRRTDDSSQSIPFDPVFPILPS